MLPAVTTISAGIPTAADVAEMHSMGLQWFNNCGIRAKNRDGMLADFNKYNFNWRGPCDGVSLDELTLGEIGNLDRFAWALRNYKNLHDRIIHVWMTGGPVPTNSNCFSAVINSSRGRGRLLHEIYKHTQRSEEEAALYWENVRQGANVTRKILGEQAFRNNFSIILGLFNDSPSISLNIHPHVDYKYFLEMQIRSLAMDKEFDGLSGIGFWGIHHATEEAVRWGFALFRHYAIEGRRDWLCEKYGFTYIPGLLQNPDFEEALAGWEANALVRSGDIKGLGSKVQHRYGAPAGVGDKVAVFSREENEYGELSQVMTGFVPGNVYSMTFFTANYKDLQENLHNPKRQPISYTLENAEILKNTRVVDRTKAGSDTASQKARINTTKVIFKANSPEIKLIFDNRKALPGEETVLNGICVTPYFRKEKTL